MMKLKRKIIALMTSLVLCCTMGTTELASERTEVLSIRNDKNPNIVMQDVENATQYSANTTLVQVRSMMQIK